MLKKLLVAQRKYLEFFFDHINPLEVEDVFQAFLKCRGTIFFSGVGKSGLVAKKITQMLISTGTKASFLQPVGALHGDLGVVQKEDLDKAVKSLKEGGFTALGEVTEHSTLKMHATMLASKPGFTYWNSLTLRLIEEVWHLRKSGIECYFTVDAGPHVKVLCQQADAEKISGHLQDAGAHSTNMTKPGAAATLMGC